LHYILAVEPDELHFFTLEERHSSISWKMALLFKLAEREYYLGKTGLFDDRNNEIKYRRSFCSLNWSIFVK
jgi:hypothetical protein